MGSGVLSPLAKPVNTRLKCICEHLQTLEEITILPERLVVWMSQSRTSPKQPLSGIDSTLNHSGCPAEIVAHRGVSAEAPENTLASIELAWALEVDAVEVDVHLSKDGRLVVIHEATLQRTAGRDERVGDLTAAELSAVDVGSSRATQFSAERAPLLADVQTTIPPGRRLFVCLFVEIKCGTNGGIALQDQVAVSSRCGHQLSSGSYRTGEAATA